MVSKTTEFELNKWELNCEICSYKTVSNMSDPVHLAMNTIGGNENVAINSTYSVDYPEH